MIGGVVLSVNLADYIGCSCEIITMDNDLLQVGKIQSVLEDEKGTALEIAPSDGEEMMTAAYGLPVKINIFSNKLGFLGLGGKIYIAHGAFWRINEISTVGQNERRDYFRVKVNTHAEVIGPVAANETDTFKCAVLSVSLSGLLFAVEDESCNFSIGTELEVRGLRVQTDGSFFDIRCEVCRTDEHHALGKLYGCRYIETDTKDTDRLCQDIFAKQRYDIQKQRRII